MRLVGNSAGRESGGEGSNPSTARSKGIAGKIKPCCWARNLKPEPGQDGHRWFEEPTGYAQQGKRSAEGQSTGQARRLRHTGDDQRSAWLIISRAPRAGRWLGRCNIHRGEIDVSLFGPGVERPRDIKAEQSRARLDDANESTRRTVTVEELNRRGR